MREISLSFPWLVLNNLHQPLDSLVTTEKFPLSSLCGLVFVVCVEEATSYLCGSYDVSTETAC